MTPCLYALPWAPRYGVLRGNELPVFSRRRVFSRHPRLTRRYDYRDEFDHHLDILMAKPDALAGSTALDAARKSGPFTEAHEAIWAAARAARDDAAGSRALIEVLLLHWRMDAAAIQLGMAAALRAGVNTADVVAVEARRAAQEAPEAGARWGTARGKRNRVLQRHERNPSRLESPLPVSTAGARRRRPSPTPHGLLGGDTLDDRFKR
ncbi:hypothetical protein ACGF0K_36070 [Streptomyces sp. NPDC048156]|uniref:hypothetical protein n=1 Tax=Streptomyces sp. NPDC048156 TaxID=3365502 RepID=UPI003715FF70